MPQTSPMMWNFMPMIMLFNLKTLWSKNIYQTNLKKENFILKNPLKKWMW